LRSGSSTTEYKDIYDSIVNTPVATGGLRKTWRRSKPTRYTRRKF